jgi:hypothetical protein
MNTRVVRKKKEEDPKIKKTQLDISDPTVMFSMIMPMVMMIMMMAIMMPILKGLDDKRP